MSTSIRQSQNLMDANRQWATRQDDEKYLDLPSLHSAALAQRNASTEEAMPINDWRAILTDPRDEDSMPGMRLALPDGRELTPTWHSFGQLSRQIQAPADYLRRIHPKLAAANINYGLAMRTEEKVGTLINGGLRAITSTSYGRIWDHEVVELMMKINEIQNGVWQIPPANAPWNRGQQHDPKQLTTLYLGKGIGNTRGGSNLFMFMVDETRPIEVGKTADGQPDLLCRGLIMYNSEVGDCVFGIKGFLYRYVCANRIIWGAEQVRELRIRHSSGAPSRFIEEGLPMLEEYAGASLAETANIFRKAKALTAGKTDDDVIDWLGKTGGYSKAQSLLIMKRAETEEGDNRSVWSLAQGATAIARDIPNSDTRIEAEERGSRLLAYAA